MNFIGVDIGGTKCVVSVGEVKDNCKVLKKYNQIETKKYKPQEVLDLLLEDVKAAMETYGDIQGIGISCGSPLDSKNGLILSPPNLLGWDNIEVSKFFYKNTGIKTWLCNDANACAIAEWKEGAGRGSDNMIFLTFGTGMGAGMILNKILYTGSNDMAGEVGHIRLADNGPTGFGKIGSFEGFCSGGGVAQLGQTMILEHLQKGEITILADKHSELHKITTKDIGMAADKGDYLAKEILKKVGYRLGQGLSIIIDFINPDCIVIGSVFTRCYDHIWQYAKEVIDNETLYLNNKMCEVKKSELQESIGDVAAILVASYFYDLDRDK